MNRERLRRLWAAGKLTGAGLDAVKSVYDPRRNKAARIELAPDVKAAIDADPDAAKNFRRLPAAYRRIRIAYIEAGRRHGQEEFRKRLRNFVKRTAANQRFGWVREMRG